MPWEENPVEFCKNAKIRSEKQTHLFSDDDTSDEVIYFSCTPWFDFTSLTNERNFDNNDTIPRIAWGKYYNNGEQLYLHMSIEINHRTIDGIHIGFLKENIDKEIKKLC